MLGVKIPADRGAPMLREISPRRALVNAAAVLLVLMLAGFGGVQVLRRHWAWQETFPVRADFPHVGGLEVGDRVRLQGLDAGVVEAIAPPAAPGGPIRLTMRLDDRLRPLVRGDATARIVTQGVVGSKVLELVPGRPDAPPLAPGQALRAEAPRELADLLADAQAMMADAQRSLERLDAVAVAAEAGLGEIHTIAATVARGEGTLGKLVRDDEAYRRIIGLTDRGDVALRDLSDNLGALKQTWPLTRYFDRRGYEDVDRLLYQPGAKRDGRVLAEGELFEPGRAVLTAAGRKQLDAVASWFQALKPVKTAEVVVAAFVDEAPEGDEDLARVLTQEQADAVKAYLMERHKIHSNGWFAASRKVAAVGYGTRPPRTPDTAPAQSPPRRVEIVVFTPQA
jgi:phospholipid/cholesterol/gamma-HCH transport system substrate-binding protein